MSTQLTANKLRFWAINWCYIICNVLSGYTLLAVSCVLTPYKLSDRFMWYQSIRLKLIEHIKLLDRNKRCCEVFESVTLQTVNELHHTYNFISPLVALYMTRCLTPVESNYVFVTFYYHNARLLQTLLFENICCLKHFVECQIQFYIALLRDIASYSHWSRADVTYFVSCAVDASIFAGWTKHWSGNLYQFISEPVLLIWSQFEATCAYSHTCVYL